MKLIATLLVIFCFESFASDSSTKNSNSENISSVYLKKISSESAELKTFQKKFKASPKSYCPHYSGADESTCFKNFLLSYQVKSSSQAMLMTTIASSVGLNDGRLGYSQQMTRILMLENVIVLYENLDLAKFHLSEIKPETSEGKAELKLLKNSDEQILSGSFKKIEAVLLKGLSTVEKKRSVASVEEWKKKKIGELRTRLEKLKKVSWKYPT
ncbi:MAG: hypothetical protein K0R29_1348 [Pseudobdellovibrio sp.]|nr:hypothetical protein [Pseudobdellovibrio sp.]